MKSFKIASVFVLSLFILFLGGRSLYAQECIYQCPGASCRWTACGMSPCPCPDNRIYVVDIGYDDVNPCVEICAFGSCTNCTGDCNCGGCFPPDTPVKTPEGEEAIIDLTEGDEVVSFDPETGEASAGIIQKTFEFTRNAYYKIRTKEGKELKVTGTHPLFAKRTSTSEESSGVTSEVSGALSFIEYLKTESLTSRIIRSVIR